jgi:predicted nicotinamide N-methyase
VFVGDLSLHLNMAPPMGFRLVSLLSLRTRSVWPVAHAVCAHLQDASFFAPRWWAGKRVLELGAGTGIVGMCAAVLIATAEAAAVPAATSATSMAASATTTGTGTAPPDSSALTSHNISEGGLVCLTDIGRHVDLLRRNVALNMTDLEDRVTVCDFQWFVIGFCCVHRQSARADQTCRSSALTSFNLNFHLFFCLPCASHAFCLFCMLDPFRGTSIDALPGPFDVIVGSDITYDADYFDVLLDSIDALCSASDRETVCFSISLSIDGQRSHHKITSDKYYFQWRLISS